MDSALKLRMLVDSGEVVADPSSFLSESELIKKFADLENLTTLGKIFALIGVAEIPFSYELKFVQELVTFINENVATESGFSITGKKEGIVPCYNAMLLEAYIRLGLGATKQAKSALKWITTYQVFERNQKIVWQYDGICKYGGCMKNVPCYIGIGKSVRAFLTYKEKVTDDNLVVNDLIQQGLAYMLKHKMFKRLSSNQYN
ncbi:hypothetical protein M2139_001060 [Enterococcus sp. PF1-24]|uniref:hypothetical protein n=1 Tax=unclassified Enterococcus TaxID=2608891 RepID=UPI002476C948|nr:MULTISPECIES: hypothetical protein [unclassified Enterococcus]MDH6364075.1 hypothetical protein [Enterococcus sp. PFB1-1]MDH6401176.1 hypothetical protein [Enterococcus sp. PF1-24]